MLKNRDPGSHYLALPISATLSRLKGFRLRMGLLVDGRTNRKSAHVRGGVDKWLKLREGRTIYSLLRYGKSLQSLSTQTRPYPNYTQLQSWITRGDHERG